MKKEHAVLATLGLIELALTILASRVVDRETNYPVYLCLYFAMGLPWLLASYYAVRRASDSTANRDLVLVFAIAMRVPFLATEPILSDDIFRYVWDGRVQHAGINPYIYAPDAEELAFLRNDLYPGINNKDIPTIYPPAMEWAFYGMIAISESLFFMKAFFVLCDLALIFVLSGILRALGLNPVRAVIYGWSPLVIVEVAGSGHNDALAVLGLFAAQWALLRHRDVLGMALLTLSGLAKVIGYALAPLFLRAVRARALVAMGLVTFVLTLPYASAGGLAFRGLTQYGLRWRSNDSLFHVLFALTGSLDTAKIIVAATLVTMVLVLVFLNARPLRSSYLTVGAILLLTPTVHPWYLLWVAPFLAIYVSPAWLYLCLSVGLSYHSAYLAVPGEAWEDVVWVKVLEYVPFFVLAISSAVRELRAGTRARRVFFGLHSPP